MKTGKLTKHSRNPSDASASDINLSYIPQNSNKVTKDYRIFPDIIGKGGFGEVRKAIHLATNEIRAIKIIYKKGCSRQEEERMFNEIKILCKLDHPNIVRIYEYFHDEKNIFIVMELITGGELFDRIISAGHFSERKAAEIFHQILSAVNYIHCNNIVHRDLKPENILFDGDVIKLVDFGTSRLIESNEKLRGTQGTTYYIAPEVFGKSYNSKCDVWSCGVILYLLLSGIPPFQGRNDLEVQQQIKKGKFRLNIPEFAEISLEAKSLITQMLTYDPKQRISVKEALEDPWFGLVLHAREVTLKRTFLENLKNFHLKNKMQGAIYFFIVNNLASKEDKRDLIKMFKALDLNQDGVISEDELMHGLKLMNVFMSEEEVKALMDMLDKSHTKTINYTEFVGAAIDKNKILSDEKILKCFKMFDKDRSGKISIAEFKQMLEGKNSIDPEVWRQMIKDFDDNGDGEIEFQEFKDLLKRIIN